MNDAQRHRGPDGEGYAVDGQRLWHRPDRQGIACATGRCGLAHRRLAVLDPARGLQPMASADRRYVICFNGVIYNFQALRRELQGEYPFTTDCDTETLLALHARNPDRPQAWIRRLKGIFAFAIWDRARRRLLLARDPYGVKPLHLAHRDNTLLFASEIKSLLAAGIPPVLNRAALHVFMNVRYVPGNDTLFAGIRRFPPGHYAWVRAGEAEPRFEPYYTLPGPGRSLCDSDAALCERIRHTFHAAVRSQLLSDVPIGFSLSGGLDSSMNVAAARRALDDAPGLRSGDRALHTFTLGFNEPTDELEAARVVARRFGTHHREQKLRSNPLDDMRAAIRAVEEPKINVLQSYQLARTAAPDVKVLLSGLGGDELFAGYDIHRFCNTLGRGHALTPDWVQTRMLQPISSVWWRVQQRSQALRFEHYRIGGQIALALGDRAQFYARLRNAWDDDAGMYTRVYSRPEIFRAYPSASRYFEPFFAGEGDFLDQTLRAEFQTKMVNDFLVNEDRATAAHGLEGRVPFLDGELVELAFAIPGRAKMNGRKTKTLWKRAVGGELPADILDKKKQGFTFSPYHLWTKDLRGNVERELTPGWCAETDLFNPRFVRQLLDYPPHPNLRWHYFMAWMMLGVKIWMDVFGVRAMK